MNKLNKNKEQSSLVESVLALDHHFAELDRLSTRIQEIELKSDFDYEQTQRLMNRFAECGQSVSTEVVKLAKNLNEARAQAEAAAEIVAIRAAQIQARRDEQETKMESFRQLAGKVTILGQALGSLKKPEGESLSAEERAKLTMSLTELDLQLRPLIEEAHLLKKEAQNCKMKTLEQNADSLRQSLQAVSQKLSSFNQPSHLSH